MVDVPTKGDPVLLCTMGGINYYLGPLNTAGNPNFNMDNFKTDEVKLNFEDKELIVTLLEGCINNVVEKNVTELYKTLQKLWKNYQKLESQSLLY